MTPADKLRALLEHERDEEMKQYYQKCLEQIRLAPIRPPVPTPPRRCWTGPMDVVMEVER